MFYYQDRRTIIYHYKASLMGNEGGAYGYIFYWTFESRVMVVKDCLTTSMERYRLKNFAVLCS